MVMNGKLYIEKRITVESLYNSLEDWNDILLSSRVKEITVSFQNLEYISADAIVPCMRAMVILAKSVFRKCEISKEISVVESTSTAFLFLYHIKMFEALEDYYCLSDEQRMKLDYLVVNKKFNLNNRVLGIKPFDYMKHEMLEHYDLPVNDNDEVSGRYIRDILTARIRRTIEYAYSGTLSYLSDINGAQYVDSVMWIICELVTNAIFHGRREAFMFFQRGITLPSFLKYSADKCEGILVSVGDTGVGFKKSLARKSEISYLEEINVILDRIKEKYLHDLSVRDSRVVEDLCAIYTAIYYSKYKQDNESRYGLYSLIEEVVRWNGRVSVYYGNCRIMIEEKIEDFGKFIEGMIKSYFVCKEKRNISYMAKQIPGVQIDIEILKR